MLLTRDIISTLTQNIRQIERAHWKPVKSAEILTSGRSQIDQLLKDGGFPRCGLVEWLAPAAGCGATSCVLDIARRAVQRSGVWVWIDAHSDVYAPAIEQLGINLDRLVVVRPPSLSDGLWCWEQSLRSRGVAIVLGDVERLPIAAARRLQLAAETGGTLGFLWRPMQTRSQPSWADQRWIVLPCSTDEITAARRWKVELLRARGQWTGGIAEVGLNDDERASTDESSDANEPVERAANQPVEPGESDVVEGDTAQRDAARGTVAIEADHGVRLGSELADPTAAS